jgi:tetratricopeptide (TPR) repeat protein
MKLDNLKEATPYFKEMYAIEGVYDKIYHSLYEEFKAKGLSRYIDENIKDDEEKITPTLGTVVKLATLYWQKALLLKEADNSAHVEYLTKAISMFEKAFCMDHKGFPEMELYHQYALFRFITHTGSDKTFFDIANSLRLAILKEDANDYEKFNIFQKFSDEKFAIKPLQELFNQKDWFKVNLYASAYYMLIDLHIMHGKRDEALAILDEFKNAAIKDDDEVTKYLLNCAQKECGIKPSWVNRISSGTIMQSEITR